MPLARVSGPLVNTLVGPSDRRGRLCLRSPPGNRIMLLCTAVGLMVALQCYDLHDGRGVWRGVALVNEDEWRFEVYDAEGRRTESGPADALLSVLKGRGLVETTRPCSSIFTPCYGRATRC